MTTMEHLFMQIFERKNWIEDQLKQQIESYGQSLAYNLLADGERPPPWLWTTGLDPFHDPDPKGFNREQLISGILLPLPRATTHANHTTFSTMPVLKDANVSQPNSFTEMCASDNYFFPEHRDTAVPNRYLIGSEQNPDTMMESSVVESYTGFDPLSRIQRSTSRKRDLEIRFSKKAKTASNPGTESAKDEYTGRMTRSRSASVNADCVKESSVANNLFYLHNGDHGMFSQSRSRFTDEKFDCFNKPTELPKSLNCEDDGGHQVTESQIDFSRVPSVYRDNLACNNGDKAVVAPHTCTMEAVAKELETIAACPALSRSETSFAVPSLMPDTFPLVEPRKLLFDGIEVGGLKENSSAASVKKNQGSSSKVALATQGVLSVKEDLLCREVEKANGSPASSHIQGKDALQCRIEEADRIQNGSVERERHELLEVQDSECHSQPTSGNHSVQNDVYKKISLEGLMKYTGNGKSSEMLKEVPRSGESCKPHEINSLVVPKDLLFDSMKEGSLYYNFSAALEKGTKDRSSHIPFTNVEGGQPSQDVLLSVESSYAGKANVVSGEVQEGVETSATSESASSSYHTSGHRVSESDTNKKSPLETPGQCALKEGCTGKRIIETNDSLFQQIDTVCSHCSGLFFSVTDGALREAETSAVDTLNRNVGRSTLTPVGVGTHNAMLECRNSLRNSDIDGKTSCSCKSIGSVLHSSNEANEHLTTQETTDNASTMDVENTVGKIPNTADSCRAEAKARYSLRSSTSIDSNLTSLETKGPLPCFEENAILLGTDAGYIHVGPKYENSVNRHMIIPNSVQTRKTPTKARYFLRSLTNCDNNAAFFGSNAIDFVNSSKQSIETIAQACEISWPKRRKMECRSNNIFATSPRIRLNRHGDIRAVYDRGCSIENAVEIASRPVSLSSEIVNKIPTASDSPLEFLHQNKNLCMMEDGSYLRGNDQGALASLLTEHTHEDPEHAVVAPLPIEHKRLEEPFPDRVDGNSSVSSKKARTAKSTVSRAKRQCTLEDGHGSPSPGITGYQSTSNPGNCEIFLEREQYDVGRILHAHYSASSSRNDDFRIDCDETMPEFEGFSIDVPTNMEDVVIFSDTDPPGLSKEPASVLEQQCKSVNLPTPLPCPSTKYKVHKVPEAYQSLPAGLLEHMNLSYSLLINDADMKLFSENDYSKLTGLSGNLGSQFDGSFMGRPYSQSLPFLNTKAVSGIRKPPLTPPVLKFSQKVVSGRSGASSEKVGSNPELICFRIDENSSTIEENMQVDELGTTEDRDVSRGIKDTTNRKALADVTAEYHNTDISKKLVDRGSLESVDSESNRVTRISSNSSLGNGYVSSRDFKMGDKENLSLPASQNTVRKAAKSHRNRSTKPKISLKTNERNRCQGFLEKGCKPSNIISNISSFVPLVRQKQQAAAPLKGKKDIKVKALEAAEAAKRLEEKKQIEREMRKASAKLERERLEQENIKRLEFKQKQKEEERKKKEADIAARKRQREEDERREKERKRRCIEETRKLQREQEERLRAEKAEKELQRKVSDEKERRKKELVGAKQLLNSEKGAVVAGCQNAAEVQPCNSKVAAADARHGSNNLEALDGSRTLNVIEKVIGSRDSLRESHDPQSYDISPYKDSDDEDGDEESRREKKYIPLWARRESLDQVILSKQHLDPTAIFCRKNSFNLSEVLSTRSFTRAFR